MSVYCQTLVLLFHNTSLLPVFDPLNSAYQHILSQNLSPYRCVSSFIYTTKLRPLLHFSTLRLPQNFLSLCSFHCIVFKSIAAITYPSISMAPKRKATDAGSSSSPLKKRNAVTAGIGRAAEPESNGIGFGYYGRTDDREDVSKTVSLSPCSLCSIL